MGTHTSVDHVARLVVAGTIEIAVTIIATCIPMLRVLLRDVQMTYLSSGSDSRGTRTDRSRGSNPLSNAEGPRLDTQLCKRLDDVLVPMPAVKPVVMQEKSWTITYSPASEYVPDLDYPPATTLPRAAGARPSVRSLPLTSFRLAQDPVSPISIPAASPRTPPQARRHTIDWRVQLDLSPADVRFDDVLPSARGHGESVEVDTFV